jgi:ATP-binding cassette subfamily B protein/subfamily B ATP-binding cassette protein MsbA
MLILDEATSALDEDTEARILAAITQNYGKTIIIITHRRSMLQYCSHVIQVGEDGSVTMQQLTKQNQQ